MTRKSMMLIVAFAIGGAVILATTTAYSEDRAEEAPVRDRPMLKKFDTDGDGTLSQQERAVMRRKMNAADRQPAPGRARLLARFDADGNGALSPDEWAKVRKDALEKFDADGDGTLSPDERARARAAMSGAAARKPAGAQDPAAARRRAAAAKAQGASPEARKRFADAFDTDGNGRLSPAERTAMFKKFDRDGDGSLDREEFAAVVNRMMRRPAAPAKRKAAEPAKPTKTKQPAKK